MNTNYPGLEESQGQSGDQMLPDHQDKHFLSPLGLGRTGHSATNHLVPLRQRQKRQSQSQIYSDNLLSSLLSSQSPQIRRESISVELDISFKQLITFPGKIIILSTGLRTSDLTTINDKSSLGKVRARQ